MAVYNPNGPGSFRAYTDTLPRTRNASVFVWVETHRDRLFRWGTNILRSKVSGHD